MKGLFKTSAQQEQKDFSRLGTLYMLALATIAVIIIVGQSLIQIHLKSQVYNSKVVNIAGKQRMLSQKISKLSLLIKQSSGPDQRTTYLKRLKHNVHLWKTSQEGLLHGNDTMNLPGDNSKKIQSMFVEVLPYYREMLKGCKVIIDSLNHNISTEIKHLEPHIYNVLKNETSFLNGMNAIVNQYDQEARQKVSWLSKAEYILLSILMGVIVFEILFLFKPTAKSVNQTLRKRIESEQNAQKMTKEIGVLYSSLEKSYEKLSSIHAPVENPRLFAKSDKGGNVKYVSDMYCESTGYTQDDVSGTIADLFPDNDFGDDLMDDVIDTVSEGHTWRHEIKFKTKEKNDIWLEVHITPVFNSQQEIMELFVICSDLTKRKKAEINMKGKDREEIEKRIKEQKFRSVLILEGQEEERKRIAMDIHDGIGQLLTSLKFQIESIDHENQSSASEKIDEAKILIKDLIKEVRRVTFNLKPTVLSDYGISAGLSVFIKEINKLTNVELHYENQTNFNRRLPSKIENNIYRIVQEAINNAIKYSESPTIDINLYHDSNELKIVVQDKGKGFDEKLLQTRDHKAESGSGFFNMFERTEYINGKLDINSTPGFGTTIKLMVPLNEIV